MRVYLGADHGGYNLKEKIKSWLDEWGYPYEDLGNIQLDNSDDYPDFAFKVAEAVARNPDSLGILACRSATGMVIAANKVRGVRAIDAYNEKVALHGRDNNYANILALSGDWLSTDQARKIIKVFIETSYSAEDRHKRRVETINKYESNH